MKSIRNIVLLAGLLGLVVAGPGAAVAEGDAHLVIDIAYEDYGWGSIVATFDLTGTYEDAGAAEQLSFVYYEDGSSTSVHRLHGDHGTIDVQIDLDAPVYVLMAARRIGSFTVLSGTDEYETIVGEGEALQTITSAWGSGGYGWSVGPLSAAYYHLDTDPPPNVPPLALFNVYPAGPQDPLTVTFAPYPWDEDGIVVGCEWDFDGDGEWDDDTGLYVTYTYPEAGTYTAILRVTDNDGATATASVEFTLTDAEPEPPDVSLTAPAAGSTVSGTAVTLAADATDAGGISIVQFFVNGILVGSDTTSPHSTTWNSTTVANGAHTISVTAWNTAGLSASDSVTVNVNNGPPPLAVTSIAPNQMAAGSSVSVVVAGTGFAPGTKLSFANGVGATPVASNVVVTGATSLTAKVTAKKTGPKGAHRWDVIVTAPDGRTAILTAGFTVTR